MKEKPQRDNTKQVHRILYRLKAYRKSGLHALSKGVKLKSMLLTKFPFLFRDQELPVFMELELTDACNLKCDYCNNPLFSNPRQFMKPDVMERVLEEQEKNRIERVMIGGGEPTLHPKFFEFSQKLKSLTSHLEIVTNAHWTKEGVADVLADNYDLIELSLDAGGKEHYEDSRKGGDYEKVVRNIRTLAEKLGSKKKAGLLVLRLMIRPSVAHLKDAEARFWSKYCDAVKPQYIMKSPDVPNERDVYFPKQFPADEFPKCTLPFKKLQVKPNGDIPMCDVTGNALDPKRKLTLSNIIGEGIREVWNGRILSEVRKGHRHREPDKMAICQGCSGR